MLCAPAIARAQFQQRLSPLGALLISAWRTCSALLSSMLRLVLIAEVPPRMSLDSALPSRLLPASPRLKSIDVFRGATIVAMILVNGQFSREDSYPQLA